MKSLENLNFWGKWWAMRDSNSRHPRCKRGALPTELIARRVGGRDLCGTGSNRKRQSQSFCIFLNAAMTMREAVETFSDASFFCRETCLTPRGEPLS
nr:hypothetical protein SHINE37_40996 [Rhizobiaceae bacterium]